MPKDKSKRKPRKKKTPSDKSVSVAHSGEGKGRRSWRTPEHTRSEPYDGSVEKSKLRYINPHQRNPRRTKEEVDQVINDFLFDGKVPKRYIKKTVTRKGKKTQKTVENPRFIADMRILQRRGYIDSKLKPTKAAKKAIEAKKKAQKRSRVKVKIPPAGAIK
jgi:hypothetical protein